MYTEENEFNYNDYQDDYDNNTNNNKDLKGLIIKICLITLAIIIIIFLVFKIKNLNKPNSNNNNVDNSVLVFNNNQELLRNAAQVYFFQNKNLPTETGEVVTVNISKLISEDLIKDIYDYDGTKCGYNTSYVSLTKNSSDYLMKINLTCPSLEKAVTYYYDLEYNCLTCNGETYVSKENTLETDNSNNNSNSNNNNTDNSNNSNSNNNSNNNTNTNTNKDNSTENTITCNVWSDWTTENKTDANLVKEERTKIIAYKDNYIYGEWSDYTKDEIIASDTLEVQTEDRTVTNTTTSNWSNWSTTKPEETEGRSIETKSVKTKNGTTTACETVQKYTKSLTYKDSNALSCTKTGTNKYVCIYNKVCKTKTKYKTTTYYRYQDTLEISENIKFYRSRTITKGEPIKTDYIEESQIPEGYQKLPNSEIKEYRYKESCK